MNRRERFFPKKRLEDSQKTNQEHLSSALRKALYYNEKNNNKNRIARPCADRRTESLFLLGSPL